MTFLIFGKNGQLGSCLVDLLDRKKIKYIALSKKEADITDKNKVEYIIGKYKPTTVINAAAYTQVRESESNPNIAFEINQNGIKNIAIARPKSPILLTIKAFIAALFAVSFLNQKPINK